MNLPGLVTGILGLAALEVVTSSAQATARLGGLATFGAAAVKRVIDPSVALLPNFRDASNPGTAPAAATTAESATPSAAEAKRLIELAHLPTQPGARLVKPSKGRKPEVAPPAHP
jgi:hypothetical protein